MNGREPCWEVRTGAVFPFTAGLDFEACGALLVVCDAIALFGGRLPDQPRLIAGLLNTGTRHWERLRRRLLDSGHGYLDDGFFRTRFFDEHYRRPGSREAISPALRAAVIERDGEVCVYCGATEGPFQIDHVVPVAKGGPTQVDNLSVACRSCNLAKRDKDLEDWMAEMAR